MTHTFRSRTETATFRHKLKTQIKNKVTGRDRHGAHLQRDYKTRRLREDQIDELEQEEVTLVKEQ